MKKQRLPYFLLTAGIFIFTCSALFGASITTKFIDTGGPYKTNKITAHVLDNIDTRESSYFTLENMKHLEKYSLKDTDMAYVSEDKAYVSYKNRQCEALVLGVSSKYINFNHMQLKLGSFITPGSKNAMTAVIDEELALELFNNHNVIGMDIELYNRKFKIVGVIKEDDSIIGTLSDSGYSTIYIPIEDMLEHSGDSRITSLEVKTEDTGTTGKNKNDLTKALASIGKNISNYKVVDYNIEKISISGKHKLSIFISGMGAIILLLLSIKDRIRGIYTAVKTGLEEKYLIDILKQDRTVLCLTLIEILSLMILAYFIYKTVGFSLYIPPEYIPDELIDTEFFSELFKDIISMKIQSAGYTPPFQEIQLNVLKAMGNWNFFVHVLAGFPLFYFGLYLLKASGEKLLKVDMYCSIFLVLSAMACLLFLTVLNMPVAINLKELLVVFIFIYLSAIRMCNVQKV